jgi:uncharacterized membrane protein YadS
MSIGASNKILFFLGVIVVLSGLAGPPVALALGIAFGMLLIHPYAGQSRKGARLLLQFSVVALGFGMNFGEVLRSGRSSFVFTAVGITLTMAIGVTLGGLLKVRSKTAFLVTAGTAICGGSAIAAIAPLIGVTLHLTQSQFGLWAALAIHDTSSVVGAAAKFGSKALAVATVVKLTRALWIIPLTFLTAWTRKSKAQIRLPWFIVFFCLAALARTSFSGLAPVFGIFVHAAHSALALTLFLIGTGISAGTIRRAGVRVMVQGILLWAVVATASLFAIRAGWVRVA